MSKRKTRVGLCPIVDEDSRFLILGTFPSEKSLNCEQYYADSRNQFWRIMKMLFNFDPTKPYNERRGALLQRRIAVSDMIEFCDGTGSSDKSIRDGKTNDSAGKDAYGGKVKRSIYFASGTVCLVLGVVGIFLPILPTTPLLLLSIACYYRSSHRMHSWMLNNRWFGKYLKNYAEGKGISLKAKVFTISLLWILIVYSAGFVVNNLIVQVVLVSIAIGVTIHLVRLPTLKME